MCLQSGRISASAITVLSECVLYEMGFTGFHLLYMRESGGRIEHLIHCCDRHGDMRPGATHITQHTLTSYHVAAVRKFDTSAISLCYPDNRSGAECSSSLSALYKALGCSVCQRATKFRQRNLLYNSK